MLSDSKLIDVPVAKRRFKKTPARPDMAQMADGDLMMFRARQELQRRRRDRVWPAPRKFTWRDVPRVELPEWIILRALRSIGRAFVGTVFLLMSPVAAIGRRLERHLEQLDDKGIGSADLEGLAAAKRGLAIWLTQSPNSARRPIPEETSDEASSASTPDLSMVAGQGSSQPSGRAS